jgi:modulator of FtsH protease
MSFNNIVQGQFHPAASIEVNQVLRKTYLLLACSLLFSVFATYFAMVTQARPVGILFFILGTLGLNYLAVALRDSRWGILAVFLYTGFLGYTLGPILNFYLQKQSIEHRYVFIFSKPIVNRFSHNISNSIYIL